MSATRVFDIGVGYPLLYANDAANYIDVDLNGSTVKYAWIFQSESTDAITHIGFRYTLRTGTPPVYLADLQSVNTSDGKPSGTILGGGSPASATFTPPASTAWDGTWQWIALTNAYTPAVGDLIAIVIEYSSGTINGSNFGRFTNRGLASDSAIFVRPYGATATGGTWTLSSRPWIMGYKTANRAYGKPHTLMTNTSYSSDSVNDAFGMVFNIPAAESGWTQFVLRGIRWLGRSGDTAARTITVRLKDLSGGGAGVAVVTETIDADQMPGGNTGFFEYMFLAPPSLTTGVKYVVLLEAGGTLMNINMAYITTPGATEASAFPGGANFWLGKSADNSTVTEDTSVRPCMGLFISQTVLPAVGIGAVIGQSVRRGSYY